MSILQLSKRIGIVLRKQNLTLAVAESCTGGLLSSVITDVPGSSDYFILGLVTYCTSQKENLLKIPKSVIKKYSVVSSSVAKRMAQGVKRYAHADVGIGITGFAGPGGGTKTDPRGTVYIGIAFKKKTTVKRFLFRGTRIQVKRKAVEQVLLLLQQLLTS